MTENMSLLLTPSQEFMLLTDQDVGSVIKSLEMDNTMNQNQEQSRSDQFVLQNVHEEFNIVCETDQYQNQFTDNQNNGAKNINNCNELVPYTNVPVLLPVPPPVTPLQVVPAVPQFISREDYSGPMNFEVLVDPHFTNKNPWVYSTILNKMFIGMCNIFPVDFKWKPLMDNLFVRATPLFVLAQHSQEMVVRCVAHSRPVDLSNKDAPYHILDHVIRCQHSKAQYYGSVDENVHLNVTVPLDTPQTGTESFRVFYMFTCKNSCPSGMNRRPVQVVFTLEDERGVVHGRQKLNVRVCSCPKRDKEKEEKDYIKEDQLSSDSTRCKKRKICEKTERKSPVNNPVDVKKYPLTVEICGKNNVQRVLQYCYDLTAGNLRRHGPNEHLEKCLEKLEAQIRNYE